MTSRTDERGPHALVAHRDAVGHGDGGELDAGSRRRRARPSLDRLASRSSGMLQGVTSFHDDATPTCGLSQSSSVMPTARSMARAGARSEPSVTSWERGFRPPTTLSSLTAVRLGRRAVTPASRR